MMDDLDAAGFVAATRDALAYLGGLPPLTELDFAGHVRTADELAAGLRRASAIIRESDDPRRRTERLQQEFVLLRSAGRDGEGEVLVTGYYEPVLEARREPVPPFTAPVYGVPDDLIRVQLEDFGVTAERSTLIGRLDGARLVPYPDRGAIDFEQGLVSKPEVLGYLNGLVEVFFLQVQGSGTLIFPDGERLRAGYATGNGHPYRSIGRLLLDEGAMTTDEMSMQAIRRYLRDHPAEVERVLGHNPSYVFFRSLPADGGPIGCFGVPVTAGRSIAVDRSLFPAPTAAFVTGRLPAAGGSDRPFARLVVIQDTGGAITGPGRVDLFFGTGDAAGELAGRTKHLGELFILLPK
jgi:membrane-bound lytic murein transglycosylase A